MEMTPIEDDRYHVNKVRLAVEELHRAISKAKQFGLTIDASLNGIGNPSFAYKDCLTITRHY